MVYHYSLWSWCSSRINPYAYEPEFNDTETQMLLLAGFPHSYAIVSKTWKFNRKIKTYWNAWFQWIRFGISCLCDRKIQKFKSSMLQSPYSGYLSTCSWTSYQQCTLWSHVSYSDLPRIELVHGYGDTVQANVRYASAYSLPLTKLFT